MKTKQKFNNKDKADDRRRKTFDLVLTKNKNTKRSISSFSFELIRWEFNFFCVFTMMLLFYITEHIIIMLLFFRWPFGEWIQIDEFYLAQVLASISNISNQTTKNTRVFHSFVRSLRVLKICLCCTVRIQPFGSMLEIWLHR